MSILMKDSNNILIGDIPNNWNIKRIKDIVKIKISDGPHSTPTLESEGIPFISAEAIKNNKIDFNKIRGFISEEAHREYSKKCKPQRNDIFIIKSGATTGNVAYVDIDIEFNIWSPLAVVRCNEYEAYYKFVYYQLLSDVFKKQVELSWSFGTQENIGMGVLGRLFITIPSFYEQKQIANFLDKAILQIDDAIKTKEKQLKTLEALKKSIIHKAVTKGLDDSVEMIDSKIEWIGDIPKYWRIEKLKYIGKSIIGLTYSPNDVTDKENGIHVLRSSNIQNGKMDFGNNVYVNKEIPENLITQKGDILICSRNGSRKLIGKNILIDESNCNCTFGAFMTIFRSNMNKYLYFIFNSTLFSHQAGSFMTSTINQLTINAINNMKVPIPPKDEQQNIIEYLTIEVEKINTLKENVKKQIEKLKEYKKSLIYEYVTGKKQIKE